jgi:hypothetical protein
VLDARLDRLAEEAGSEGGKSGAVAAHAVAVTVDLHQGNAGLNYRSVLRCEAGPADAELYRRPQHRRRSRRVRDGGGHDNSV